MACADSRNACGVSKCGEYVADGIQCDNCGVWFHQRCSGLTKRAYQIHKENTSLKWICAHCVALAENCQRILRDSFGPRVTTCSPSNRKRSICSQNVPDSKCVQSPEKRQHKDGKKGFQGKAKGFKEVAEAPQESSPMLLRLEKLEQEMRLLRKEHDEVVGKSRHLLLHNCHEPIIREAKARKLAEHRQVQTVFRLAGVPPSIPFVKCHRVGIWRGANQQPRPLLVVFSNTHGRDLLLSKSAVVEHNTGGSIRITPDTLSQLGGGLPVLPQGSRKIPQHEPKTLNVCIKKAEPHIVVPHIGSSTPKGNDVIEKPVKVKAARKRLPKKPTQVSSQNSAQPKVVSMVTQPSQMVVTPLAVLPEVETAPQTNEVPHDQTNSETWASVVSGTPVTKVPALMVTPQMRSGEKKASEGNGECPDSITVYKNGIVCRLPSPKCSTAQASKNEVHPRALRPRVIRQ